MSVSSAMEFPVVRVRREHARPRFHHGTDALIVLIALVAAAGTGLIVAADLGDGSVGYETWDVVAFWVVFPALPAMGRLLCRRVPGNPIGPLFLAAAGAIGWSSLAHGYGDFSLYAHPGSLPAATWVVWSGWTGWLGFGVLSLAVPLLFPDGDLPDLRWRATAAVGGAAVLAETLVLALRPGAFPDFPAADFPGVTNPAGSPALTDALRVLDDVAAPVFLGCVVLAFGTLLLRYRAGDPVRRGQLIWLATAMGVLVAVDTFGNLLTGGALHHHPALCSWGAGAARGVFGTVVPMLLYVGFPVAVAGAILRHRLYGIERIVRRSVVYGGLSLLITACYIGVAAAFGIAAGQRLPVWAAVCGTIAATLVIAPVRRRFEVIADRLVYGARKTRYQVVSEFGRGLRDTVDDQELAPRLAATVRTGLDLRWVRVHLRIDDDLRVVAIDGEPDTSPASRTVELQHAGDVLGLLECGPDNDEDHRPSAADDELLRTLADHAGLAIRNARLSTELAARLDELTASRARLAEAAEAERRRIERNIHDGAQQEIVGLIARIRLARNQLQVDAGAADSALAALADDARSIHNGLRELARGIHPSVLTDRGLVAALETAADRAAIGVRVEAAATVLDRRFPAEVEGAAYFVATEAVANAMKHSGAPAATVRLWSDDDWLCLEVVDAGVGFDPACVTPGRGLVNLADRVAAIGGTLQVSASAGDGCAVRARFPAAR